jgi:hypothetical protein
LKGISLDRPTHKEQRVAEAIRAHVSMSQLHKNYKHGRKPGDNPMKGHCYVASEAAYHMLGGKEAGYTPMNIKHEGDSHWYLQHKGPKGTRYLDLTHDQFKTPVPHHEGRGKGFLTKNPSKRTRDVIDRAKAHLGDH